MKRKSQPTRAPKERFLVVGVLFTGDGARRQPVDTRSNGDPLHEARSLIGAAGAGVVGQSIVQRRSKPDPSTLMGRGKVAEVHALVQSERPNAVYVDNDLTPAHVRNLERAFGVRVIDRSELILDIFANRAKTRQARLQVELAQVEYLRPRLRRMWTHLERTEGAVGTRGPGETQLETDRRLIDKRIRDLKVDLARIEERKQRQVRSRSERYTIGLVGYTNVGKSTLLNLVTGSVEFVADMPFATLDTRTRKWRLPDRRVVLLSDTVGFVQRLPLHLVASFHATLEEALNVDLLVHVVDASHPEAAAQVRAVEEVLAGLTKRGADVLVFNKLDLVEEPIRLHLLVEGRSQEVVYISARTGEGVDRLAAIVARRLDLRSAVVELAVPLADGRTAAAARAAGVVLSERVVDAEELLLEVKLSEGALGNLRRAAPPDVRFRVLQPVSEPLLRADEEP
ncbi:MAG: GTPase HflX [Planctomycetota bacterium]|nr:GTPase HflX [Planctomycetota bacterium]